MSDDMQSAATEQDTAPGLPLIVRIQHEAADPEDWEEEWFMAPSTVLDKGGPCGQDLDRDDRSPRTAVTPRRTRRTIPWPGLAGVS